MDLLAGVFPQVNLQLIDAERFARTGHAKPQLSEQLSDGFLSVGGKSLNDWEIWKYLPVI